MATPNAICNNPRPLEDQVTDQMLMELKNLVLWRNSLRTLFVFTSILILLVDITNHSAISVVSMLGIVVILGAMGYRFCVEVNELWNRRNYYYRFHVLMTCNIPQEEAMHLAGVAVVKLNAFINQAIALLLVEDLYESLKLLACLCIVNMIGDYCNVLTLLLMCHILVFTLPKLYELKKSAFDTFLMKIGAMQNQNVQAKPLACATKQESNKQYIEDPKEEPLKEQNRRDLKLLAMFEDAHDPDCSCAQCDLADVTLVPNQGTPPKNQAKKKNVNFRERGPNCSSDACDDLDATLVPQ